MTDAALGAIPSPPPTNWKARRGARCAGCSSARARWSGLVVIAIFILLALFAPLIVPYDPIATSWSLVRKPPSALHWFGTDDLGRDILGRVDLWRARLADGGRDLGRHRARHRRAASDCCRAIAAASSTP